MTNRKNIEKVADEALDEVQGGLLPAVMPSGINTRGITDGTSNTIYLGTANGGVWKTTN